MVPLAKMVQRIDLMIYISGLGLDYPVPKLHLYVYGNWIPLSRNCFLAIGNLGEKVNPVNDVTPVTVVTFGLPELLRLIVVESLRKQMDIDFLGHFASLKAFASGQHVRDPHVVVVEAHRDRECKDILYRYPKARVISLLQTDTTCAIWQLIACKRDLGNISPDQLAGVISRN